MASVALGPNAFDVVSGFAVDGAQRDKRVARCDDQAVSVKCMTAQVRVVSKLASRWCCVYPVLVHACASYQLDASVMCIPCMFGDDILAVATVAVPTQPGHACIRLA